MLLASLAIIYLIKYNNTSDTSSNSDVRHPAAEYRGEYQDVSATQTMNVTVPVNQKQR